MADSFCPQYGNPVPEGAAQCPTCGAAIPGAQPYQAPQYQQPPYQQPPQYQQPGYQQPPQYQQPGYQQPPQYQQPQYQPPQYQQPQYQQPQYQQPPQPYPPGYQQPGYMQGINPAWPVKSKTVAGVLGILFGGLGVHKFYLGKIGLGIVYILFCWTGIPGIIGFVEGIIYLCGSDEEFMRKNQVRIG